MAWLERSGLLEYVVGIPRAVQYAKTMGVGDVPSVPSLALGSGEVTLQQMTAAYAGFANHGMVPEPTLIRRVEDLDGQVLYKAEQTSIRAIKLNDIGALIAIDFARIFFRNATNNGLPCLTFADPADAARLHQGQRITVDPEAATAVTEEGETIPLTPPGDFVRQIWAAGGLLALLPKAGERPT